MSITDLNIQLTTKGGFSMWLTLSGYNSEQDTCGVWRSKSNSCSIIPFQGTPFFSTGIFSIKLVCLDSSSQLLQWLLTELKCFSVTEEKNPIYLRNFRLLGIISKDLKNAAVVCSFIVSEQNEIHLFSLTCTSRHQHKKALKHYSSSSISLTGVCHWCSSRQTHCTS